MEELLPEVRIHGGEDPDGLRRILRREAADVVTLIGRRRAGSSVWKHATFTEEQIRRVLGIMIERNDPTVFLEVRYGQTAPAKTS